MRSAALSIALSSILLSGCEMSTGPREEPIAGARVVGVSISPDTVDVSEADATVAIGVWIRKGVTVQEVTVSLDAPTLPETARSCSSTAPDSDGAFRCRIIVPALSWRDRAVVREVAVREEGAVRAVTAAELEAAGFPSAFVIQSPNPDPGRAALVGFSFPGTTIDVTSADATFSVVFRALSPEVGIRSFYMRMQSPSGQRHRVCYPLRTSDGKDHSVGGATLIDGTPRDGHWSCSFTLPRYAEGGDWRVTLLSLRDSLDRTTDYDSPEDFARIRVSPTFRVVSSAPDLQLPEVAGSSVTPDTAVSRSQITLSVRVRDALSGATFVRISTDILDHYFRGHPFYRACEARLASGTPNDGVWSCTIEAPTVSEPRTHSLLGVELRDRAENSGEVSKAQLDAAGAGSTFVVRP